MKLRTSWGEEVKNSVWTVEFFISMANSDPRGDSHHELEGMFKKVRPARPQPF
jgi:hypothetical protein